MTQQLKPYIRLVDVRNTKDERYELLGVSVEKCFIKSIANTVGTDWKSYKIIKKGQFCYIPDTSRRGDKMGIALLTDYDIALVSQAYAVFEIVDSTKLMPEYLNLWFKRPEFDRYARFHSHGSAREIFDWEEMCNVELPVPEISEQKKIVEAYNTIERRIELKRQINDNLEAQAQAIFDNLYAQKEDSWLNVQLGDLCKIKGGKRLPLDHELVEYKTKHPYIRVRDLTDTCILTLNYDFFYITDDTHSYIKSYIVKTNDIIISIVGTIGLISIIDSTLDGANLTENCVRLTNIERVSPNYIFFLFKYLKTSREIEERTVGAVQAKLPMYNIETINVPIPNQKMLDAFNSQTTALLSMIRKNISEIITLEKAKECILGHLSSR